MKTTLCILAAAALLCGCAPTIPTIREKSIVVTKDAEGKIVSSVTTEKIAQPVYGALFQFEYLTDGNTFRGSGGKTYSTPKNPNSPPRAQ